MDHGFYLRSDEFSAMLENMRKKGGSMNILNETWSAFKVILLKQKNEKQPPQQQRISKSVCGKF